MENVVWIVVIAAFRVHTFLVNVYQRASAIRKNTWSIKLATRLRLMSRCKMCGAVPPFSP